MGESVMMTFERIDCQWRPSHQPVRVALLVGRDNDTIGYSSEIRPGQLSEIVSMDIFPHNFPRQNCEYLEKNTRDGKITIINLGHGFNPLFSNSNIGR